MPAYDNTAVAAKLDLCADLLEISGADKFRLLSYRKAASSVRALPEQVAVLANAGRLTEIPGVGAKMALNIEQIIARGGFDALDAVSAVVPPTLADVMQVPGVGPKRAALLHEKLGVDTMADLQRELGAGRIATVGGFGPKTAENIAAGVSAFQRHHERTPLAVALPVAEQLASELAAVPGVLAIEPAGSVRRREETIGDLDLVAASDDAPGLIAAFTSLRRSSGWLHQARRRPASSCTMVSKSTCRWWRSRASVQRCSTLPATRITTSSCASWRGRAG